MPLVRFAVRNEYGLGAKELYRDGVENEDPKGVLDGVAVAGLVGLLRQLGDLSQLAAEVFHGLQEQVASTASRSRKLVTRVQRLEASLPLLEKAMLSQTSHIHFAYTRGSEWHPRTKNEQNHFIFDDLPHFIMDSYEECREPPRLQLLDRFDTAGPGSCLKRYSDPTFFRRASAISDVPKGEKSRQERKARRIKRRRSSKQSGHFPNYAPILNSSGRMQFSSPNGQGQSSASRTGSTVDMTFKSDLGDQSDFLGSKDGLDFIECVSRPSTSKPDEEKKMEVSSVVNEDVLHKNRLIYLDEQTAFATDDVLRSPVMKTTVPCSSNVTWDEKLEIMEHMVLSNGVVDSQHLPETNFYLHEQGMKPITAKIDNPVDDLREHVSNSNSNCDGQYPETTMDVKYLEPTGLFYLHEQEMKAVNAKSTQVFDLSGLESSSQSNSDGKYPKTTIDGKFKEPVEVDYLHEQEVKPFNTESSSDFDDLTEHGSSPNSNADGQCPRTIDYLHEQEVKPVNAESSSEIDDLSEHGSSPKSKADRQSPRTTIDGNFLELTGLECGVDEVQDLSVANCDLLEHDLVPANTESLTKVGDLSEGETTLELIANVNFMSDATDMKLRIGEAGNVVETMFDNARQGVGTISAEHVDSVDTFSYSRNNVKGIEWHQHNDIVGNNLNAIEWHQHDDIDSETDNFVDALNTIESESESDFESQTRKEVDLPTSRFNQAENAGTDLTREIISLPEPEPKTHSTSYYRNKGVSDDSEERAAAASVADTESLGNAQSLNKSEVTTGQKQDDLTCMSHEQSVQSTQSSSLSKVSQDTDFYANADEKRLQPADSEIAESNSQPTPDDKWAWKPNMSQEMPVGSSSSYPPALWTNGTLFGLQPSKPTVFSMSNSVNPAPMSSNAGVTVGQCSPNAMHNVDGLNRSLSSSAEDSNNGNKLDINEQDVGSSKHVSSHVLQKTCDQPLDHDASSATDDSVIRGLSDGDAICHKSRVLLGADLKNVSSEATNTGEDRSSLLSLFGRGLLKNGLRRSGSLGYDEKPKTSNPLTTIEYDNGCHSLPHTVTEANLKGKLRSPVNSPPPSPPLEHMKISFRPIDGFETSRLKLKYPEGIEHHESSFDAFPSFQLVPESAKLQHDVVSDSDDDTFCRSYACVSDDSLSDVSDSNSEHWESEDPSEGNNHAIYDGLQRKSSSESASSSPQHEERDQGTIHVSSRSSKPVNSLAGPALQLRIPDPNNQFAYEEMKACLNPEADLSHLQELTPQPPPLPPLQWRVSKPLLDDVEGKQIPETESLNQSFDSKLLESAVSHPDMEHTAESLSRTQESDKIAKTNKIDQLRVDDQKQSHYMANGRMGDDREDFLHQIRTKSFNLKRTEIARSLYSPSAATSNKVTAILQKANAIRQAVGSDGEDDSWSDT